MSTRCTLTVRGLPTTYKADKFTGYGTSLIPAGPGGSVSVVGGEDLVIAKGGKHLADTIKFVQFLQSPFAQLAMAGAGDMAAYKTDSAAEAIENPALKVFAEELLTARARPVTAGYAELDTDFSNRAGSDACRKGHSRCRVEDRSPRSE